MTQDGMRWRGRLGIALSCVLALSLSAAVVLALWNKRRQPLRLDVVRTLEELERVRPVVIRCEGADVLVHLGISESTVPANESVLVYALVDRDPKGWPLCELEVHVNGVSRTFRRSAGYGKGPPALREKPHLYIASFEPTVSGAFELGSEKDHRVVGAGVVTVTDRAVPVFIWLEADPRGERGVVEATCGARPESLFDASSFLCPPAPELPEPFVSPDLRVAMEGDVLVITSPRNDFPDATMSFAARFWVNDRPVVLMENDFRYAPVLGAIYSPTRNRVHLTLDRGRLGVRPGDRVGVQLVVVCGTLPRITNRVDFVLP